MSKKYLFLQRSQPGNQQQQPSPAQMQDMYAAFNAWKEKFKDNILDMGGKLMPGGKVVRRPGQRTGRLSRPKRLWEGTCSSRPTASSEQSRSLAKCPC